MKSTQESFIESLPPVRDILYVLVAGASASGKSSLAQLLKHALKAALPPNNVVTLSDPGDPPGTAGSQENFWRRSVARFERRTIEIRTVQLSRGTPPLGWVYVAKPSDFPPAQVMVEVAYVPACVPVGDSSLPRVFVGSRGIDGRWVGSGNCALDEEVYAWRLFEAPPLPGGVS